MMKKWTSDNYDVIVIGAGHAGCEAALAAARTGARTALVSLSKNHIATMPCNPSIGGIGKGQLVREVDALGGAMGLMIDRTALQIKKLNCSKGPAVQALRAQADKTLYARGMRGVLADAPRLTVIEGEVAALGIKNDRVKGLILTDNEQLKARAVVVTAGTFLGGRLIVGGQTKPGGRTGEPPAERLGIALRQAGLALGRFQTATPPRVLRDSVDFEAMKVEPGSAEPLHFSFISPAVQPLQIPCHLTYTTTETHEFIRQNIDSSPIKSGAVTEHGPRNCPSIDRKVLNFPDKTAHPVFVEPEGLDSAEMYLQGLTTAMPVDIQQGIVRTVPGLERAVIARPGYAVAYDYVLPDQLTPALETKRIRGLFTAGQVNGTTGYEEAAAQGLVAGLNAARSARGEDPIIIGRDEAYIGVLIDDLVTKGVAEPYRVYTSRAEFRLILRSDNADVRLTPLGDKAGLVTAERRDRFRRRAAEIEALEKALKDAKIPVSAKLNQTLKARGGGPIKQAVSAETLLRRPGMTLSDLERFCSFISQYEDDVRVTAEVGIKYFGYVKRELDRIARHRRLEGKRLPADLDYHQLSGLSFEARERLNRVGPRSLGQAARVSGVSPADISLLMVHLERINADEENRP
jgi:tRNA uridine 5-carboxymethylaminomethyl modification enzyme